MLKDYRPTAFLIDTVDLKFELHPSKTQVTATSKLRRNPDSGQQSESLVLDGEDLNLVSIKIDGAEIEPSRWIVSEDTLTLKDPPDAFALTIVTTIDPASNKALEGLYISSDRFCTQCEAEGFRKITYYLDRPDVLAKFNVTLIADKERYPVLLSNGNQIEKGDIDKSKHYAVWQDPFAKPCYLFALVAGDLGCLKGQFKTASGQIVDLHIYVEHGKEARAEYALDSLIRSMKWDEVTYGLEYDLDIFNIVAVSDFNMGAMENKSLNIFNDKFILADAETATDTDYTWIESVVAHEYFHNWTGNRVTCRDWFQLSLKEGLTVLRDQQFSADQRSQAVQRIDDVKRLRAAQFTEDASPLAHPVRPDSYAEINNFYTHTVYEKGAEVVRMIHTLIGKDAFRKGMDIYFARHDGQAVTCEDFVSAMEAASGQDLTQFMLWYRQAGTPTIHASGVYDTEMRQYTLTLTQSCKPTPGQPIKKPMHIPVAIGFIDEHLGSIEVGYAGALSPQETHVVSLHEQSAAFTFSGFPADVDAPVVSINRGFSAPVLVDAPRSEKELGILIASDPDPISRWDAAQELALSVLTKKLTGAAHDETMEALLDALVTVLQSGGVDPGLAAQILELPAESSIAEGFEAFDPTEVYDVRTWLKTQIGRNHGDQFAMLYQQYDSAAPYNPSGEDAGKRALRHQALSYMMSANAETTEAVAFDQYTQSSTMTDRWSALQVLNQRDSDLRRSALDDFRNRFADNNLVLDKWFSLEANHPSASTLNRVMHLKTDSKYDSKNPNKIRALIGSFAANNTIGFHQISGEGYSFIADQVLEIDSFNPQSAARLAGAFQQWARYDAQRKHLMHTELIRIANAPSLSQDVQEIVGKALAIAGG